MLVAGCVVRVNTRKLPQMSHVFDQCNTGVQHCRNLSTEHQWWQVFPQPYWWFWTTSRPLLLCGANKCSPTHFHLSISVGLCPHFFAGQNSSPELAAALPSQRIVPNKAEAVRIVTNRTFFISVVSSTEESSNLAISIFKKIDEKKAGKSWHFLPSGSRLFYSVANKFGILLLVRLGA